MTIVLDNDLLADFEQALRDVGAKITEVWAPGLTDAEIDALTNQFDLRLPEEARRWWRWHNGVMAGTRGTDWSLTPGHPLFDLATAMEVFGSGREDRAELYAVDYWIQPVGAKPLIFFACGGPHDEPVPVYTQQDIEDPVLATPSIGELVAQWTQLIRTDVFMTDDDGRWTWSFDRVPEDVRRLGIY
jgi:hypothetical protein